MKILFLLMFLFTGCMSVDSIPMTPFLNSDTVPSGENHMIPRPADPRERIQNRIPRDEAQEERDTIFVHPAVAQICSDLDYAQKHGTLRHLPAAAESYDCSGWKRQIEYMAARDQLETRIAICKKNPKHSFCK